jgi:MSHA pilin protein MshD
MCNSRTAGFTLVEMIIAIVIIGVGLAGVLLAFNTTVKSSADPMLHKQMLSAAEEMMEEILLKPFEPAGTAPTNSPKTCGVAPLPSRVDFDDVSDYHNYETAGICDIDGGSLGGLEGYGIKVTVAGTSLGGMDAAAGKKVTVTVTRGGETLSLVGWRTWYACDPATMACPP